MVINTNTTSLYARRTLESSTQALSKSLARLSSGSKITSPEDDAAGLAVSMKFRAEIARVGSASANVGNAISFSQTQDGFLGTVDTALRRMSELAVLAADQTKSDSDVENYQKEFAELKEFISRTSTKTFNGVGLFSSAELKDTDGVDAGSVINNVNTELLLKTMLDGGTILQAGAATGGATDTVKGLKGHYDTFITGPGTVANNKTLENVTSVAGTGVFTATGHGLEDGEAVTIDSLDGGAGAPGAAATVYYADWISANTFKLYTDKAMTSVLTVATNHVSATLSTKGEHANLTGLRSGMADMAEEWDQHLGTHDGTTSYKATKTWSEVYDFWQGKVGSNWAGVRAHGDTDRTAAGTVTGAFAGDNVHVGNSGVVSDGIIEEYKKMYSAIRSYVNNNAAGIAVTDRSDGGSYQLKGADVSFITDAIDNATDVSSVKSDLTKSNGETYAKNVSTLINSLAGTRAYVGANISRLNMVNTQLAVYGENLGAANSRIADVDVAVESANYARNQILVQSGTAMLAQANMLPQYALQLLQ